MLQRAFSDLQIKDVDEDRRVIRGIATTPKPDRAEDIVEPMGAKYALPLPFMWQHGKDPFVGQTPVGNVVLANPTPDGIPVEIQIERSDEPGRLKDILDFAWQTLKKRLVRKMSIGFNPIDAPELLKTGGYRFKSWEWLELSAVTIPMHPGAEITSVRNADALQETAVSGGRAEPIASPSARVRASVKRALPNASNVKKTYQEQISEFEATRAAKVAERDGIQAKASDEGRTKDESERAKFSELSSDIEGIDVELKDLRSLAQDAAASATVVKGASTDDATRSRQTTPYVSVKENTAPGIAMARIVICKMAAFKALQQGRVVPALEFAKQHYANDTRVVNYLKTAVAGGLTTDTNWATELVEPATVDFVEYLRHKSIIGKLKLQPRPFNIRTPRQTTGGAGYWVGEGKPKPLTKFHFDAITLPYTKVASIAVITQELARFSSPSAELIVRDQLAAACLERLDIDLIDPDKAVSSGVNPASLTNGVTALASSGTAAANVITDINNLLEQFILNKQDVSGLVLVMPNTLALAASLMITTNGVRQFPGLSINGGDLLGIPVIASQYAASGASYGNMVIAIDQNSVALADDGGFSVDVSTEASIEMVDSSSADAGTGTGASLVSMFQTNSIAIRAEREIHWVKLRSTAVSYIDDVTWGASGSAY